MNMNAPGYEQLAEVFRRAYDQAARTKGADRHANGLPFHEQPMQTVAQHHGLGFILGQAEKKSIEAHGMVKRGEIGRAQHELLGAINYLAGAIIYLDNQQPETKAEPQGESKAETDPECDCPACALKRFLGVDDLTIVMAGQDEKPGSPFGDLEDLLSKLRKGGA